jgi:hypothetical protein
MRSLRLTACRRAIEPSAHPIVSCFVASLDDLLARLETIGSAAWYTRFARQVGEYLDEASWELDNQVRRHVPTEAEYMTMRPRCGFALTWSLVGIFHRIDLAEPVFEHEAFSDFDLHLNIAACMANDMHSVDRERQGETVGLNMALILQEHLGISPDEALREVVRRHDHHLRSFESKSRTVPSHGARVDREIERYARGIYRAARGYYDWAVMDSGRYAAG